MTGLFCIVASYFRLGALADFLSKPILVGFLNGVAISIFLGQIGKLLGFSVESSGIIPRLLEVLGKIPLVRCDAAVGLELCVVLRPPWLSFDRTARGCRKDLSGVGTVPIQWAADILQR